MPVVFRHHVFAGAFGFVFALAASEPAFDHAEEALALLLLGLGAALLVVAVRGLGRLVPRLVLGVLFPLMAGGENDWLMKKAQAGFH